MSVVTNAILLARRIHELQRRRQALVAQQEQLRAQLPDWAIEPLRLVGMAAEEIRGMVDDMAAAEAESGLEEIERQLDQVDQQIDEMESLLVATPSNSLEEIEGQLASKTVPQNETSFWSALWTIILADVSMSLDNVLAVAGAAGESTLVLVIGLSIAIILMAVASNYIAKLLARYPWIAWIGLIIILWVALDMIYRDSHNIVCAAYGIGCSETLWQGVLHRLGFGGS